MPVTGWGEKPKSRSGTTAEGTESREYWAAGSNDAEEVREAGYYFSPAAIPTLTGILYRQDVVLTSVGDRLFDVSVPYARKKNQVGSWTWTTNSTGGTVNIKFSKSTVAKYPNDAKDHKQLIGVHGKDVDGTDIVIPAMKINVTFRHPLGRVNLPFVFNVHDYVGTSNNKTFLTRAPGEILFLGMNTSDGSEAEAEAGYEFAYSKNLKNLTVGTITGIDKDGWDYSWVSWTNDDGGGKPGQKPEGVYVERVYDRVDLASILGFGS